jgi:hypothetical protein
VTSQGVSSAPMGERRQRPVSDEVETDNAVSGARTRRRCSETPLHEASNEAGRWAGLLTCLAGGSARENLVRLSLVDFFP